MTAALTSVGVQQVSITIPNGSTSNTATITAVGSGAFILWQGQNTSDSVDAVSALTRIELTKPSVLDMPIGRIQWAFAEDTATQGFLIDILANPPVQKAA